MIEEGLPEGKYRLEIYECIKSVIKRDLTEAEHKYLSHILKYYANTARENKTIINVNPPLIHKWICDNCGGVTETGKGLPGTPKPKTMKKISKRNADALQKKKETQQS